MTDALNFGSQDIPEVPSSSGSPGDKGSRGFTRSVNRPKVLGSNPPAVGRGLFGKIDHDAGFSSSQSYTIGKDDRMTNAQAWETMQSILKMFDLLNVNEGDMFTFIRAMFAYHTINSASVLQPGRSKIHCLGNEFEYNRVVDFLGPDQRRFFRAYADEVRKENKRILDCDVRDQDAMQLRSWLMEVAFDRGLQRNPDLCHDSSDACTLLSAGERAAIASSKRMVLATSVNTADSLQASARVQNADKYDSTAGTSVEHADGEAGARKE